MTESEWETCADPQQMLMSLVDISERKLCLLCSCATRRLWCLLESSHLREAVESLEKYADAAIDEASFRAAASETHPLRCYLDELYSHKVREDRWFAAYAINRFMMWGRDAPSASFCLDFLARAARRASRDTLRMAEDPFGPCEMERAAQADLMRDLFADQFRPVILSATWLTWNDATVIRLAQVAYDNRILPAGTLDNARLAVLADALEESGCGDERMLEHIRAGGEHYRGCYVVDALLGKN
jgi:hypothetical protein